MKKNLPLPLKLLLAIIIGGVIGILLINNLNSVTELVLSDPEKPYSTKNLVLMKDVTLNAIQQFSWNFMQVIISVNRLTGQFISFCVPLIVLGFICPSITKMGQNAGKLLFISLIIAYLSSILAATMSAIAGYTLVPMFNIAKDAVEVKLPDAIFKLDINPIMPVISALVLSIIIGLSVVWTNAKTTKDLLAEFQNIVLDIVDKIVIPVLPIHIGTTFAILGLNGTLRQFPVFLIALIIVIIGHYIWLAVLYGVAGAYSKRNPMEVLKHYGPAYITAIGTMSSAATLSVALECANKSSVLRKDLVGFGIPLFANIHLCGSVLTETFFCLIIHKMIFNSLPTIGTMTLFIILFGIFAVGAPGVPGGTVMASLGIVESIICANAGATPEQTAIFTGTLLAIFALQDSFGTACNVTGDGALTLFLAGYAEKHGIKESE